MESTLGFGIFNAVSSGVMAAEAIIHGTSYEEKLSSIKKKLINSKKIRHKFDRMKNEDYDRLLGVLKTPPVNKLVYNTNVNILEICAKL